MNSFHFLSWTTTKSQQAKKKSEWEQDGERLASRASFPFLLRNGLEIVISDQGRGIRWLPRLQFLFFFSSPNEVNAKEK